MSEAATTNLPLASSDSASLAEGGSLAVALSSTDSATLSEDVLVDTGAHQAVADSDAALVDDTLSAVSDAVAEGGTLAESARVDEFLPLVDAASLAELAQIVATLDATDGLSLSESAFSAIPAFSADGATLQEAASLALAWLVVDAAQLAEAAQLVVSGLDLVVPPGRSFVVPAETRGFTVSAEE